MKKFLIATAAVLLAACASNTEDRPPVVDTVVIAGVQIAAIEVIGSNQVKAKAAIEAMNTIDALLDGGQVVTLEQFHTAVDTAVSDKLSPQSKAVAAVALQAVFTDVAGLAPDGVLDENARARVKVYTAAVRAAAELVA